MESRNGLTDSPGIIVAEMQLPHSHEAVPSPSHNHRQIPIPPYPHKAPRALRHFSRRRPLIRRKDFPANPKPHHKRLERRPPWPRRKLRTNAGHFMVPNHVTQRSEDRRFNMLLRPQRLRARIGLFRSDPVAFSASAFWVRS